jgi:arylsulfatase A
MPTGRGFSATRRLLAITAAIALFPHAGINAAAPDATSPNFVLILCDNLGYGDVGCYGSTKHRTPNIDRLAAEGMRLTSFYSASGVCTPSRAALMTGCYPRRVGLHQTEPDGAVLRPVSANGLHPDEVTIAEVLKARGYATACIGKWHLGDQLPFLPTRQGFDFFYGIPYSDDMTPRLGRDWPPLPLLRNEQVIDAPVDRFTLTQRYTHEAIRLIGENQDRPFFLYVPHAMPGSTQRPFASAPFRGKSANGSYGDSVEELDWSTGKILATLKRLDLERHTMVIWTSDNGAPQRDPPQGSNRPLSGWGYSTAEGGMRVPCVVRFPGRVPAGTVCDELCTMMDWLPTLARLADAAPPTQRCIDGHDIWPLLSGKPGARSPYAAFYYYQQGQLQAVRSGNWKWYVPLVTGRDRLYNLQTDRGETANVAAEHPDVVRRLTTLVERARRDLGDQGRPGANVRPPGRVEAPQPRIISHRQAFVP